MFQLLKQQKDILINNIRKRIKYSTCDHDFIKPGIMVVEGTTLSWSFTPARQVGWHYYCKKCGKHKYEGDFVIFGDRQLHPEWYDNDGWPIDPKTGERLPINK